MTVPGHLIGDENTPIFSRRDIEELLFEVQNRIESSQAFAQGAEFRYGIEHTEVAFYCGAETLGWEIASLIERVLEI